MGKITRLNTHLTNMIAAGEVIERPVSVVKELIENSIDASAKRISVSVEEGGIASIKVTDDGVGMASDDIEMSFMRHATSKIKNEYDLFRINTLGFRGEAIPSIASVSLMQIISNDGSGGYQVTYKAGSMESKGVYASNKGTSVSVRNLFFNTPARLKYLKSVSYEFQAIAYMVERIAISHPEISFELINNSQSVFHTGGNNNLIELFGELYGLSVAKNLLISDYINDGVKIRFALCKGEVYRASKSEMTIIINERYIKSNSITNAIIEGYGTSLPINKYPICAIYIDIDPLLIDVNVHPTKTQVKLSNEKEILLFITENISKILGDAVQIPDIKIDNFSKSYQKSSIFAEEKIEYDTRYIPRVEESTQDSSIKNEEIQEMPKTNLVKKLPYMEYVGNVHGTYLIFQNDDGMYLMDQHAAAERINYEKYKKILESESFPKTPLLISLNLDFTPSEFEFIRVNLKAFEELGFVMEESGQNSFFIREMPMWANLENYEEIIRYAFSLILFERNISVFKFRDEIAKEISCKDSIKANHHLSTSEIDVLVAELAKCDDPYHCPHGRPTLIKISNLELEQMFRRIIWERS